MSEHGLRCMAVTAKAIGLWVVVMTFAPIIVITAYQAAIEDSPEENLAKMHADVARMTELSIRSSGNAAGYTSPRERPQWVAFRLLGCEKPPLTIDEFTSSYGKAMSREELARVRDFILAAARYDRGIDRICDLREGIYVSDTDTDEALEDEALLRQVQMCLNERA